MTMLRRGDVQLEEMATFALGHLAQNGWPMAQPQEELFPCYAAAGAEGLSGAAGAAGSAPLPTTSSFCPLRGGLSFGGFSRAAARPAVQQRTAARRVHSRTARVTARRHCGGGGTRISSGSKRGTGAPVRPAAVAAAARVAAPAADAPPRLQRTRCGR